MAEIEKLSVSLSLETGSFAQQMSAINKQIKNAERDFKSAGKGVDDFENSFTGLAAKISKTAKQLDLYKTKLESQTKQHSKLSDELKSNKIMMEEYEKALGKNSKEWQEWANKTQKSAEKLSKLESDMKSTKSTINSLEKELVASTKAFDQLGQKTKTIDEKLADIGRSSELAASNFERLGSEMSASGSYFNKLGNELDKISNSLVTGQAKIEAYENEIKSLETTLGQQKNEYTQLENKIQSYSQHLDRASQMYGENSSQANQYRQALNRLKDEFNGLDGKINSTEAELQQFQTSLNQSYTEVNKLATKLKSMPFEKIGADLKNAGSTLKAIGQDLTTNVTLPLGAASVGIAKMSYDFEQGLSKVGTLVDKSGKEMKQYEGTIKDIAIATGTSLTGMTESMYQGISAGADLNNIFGLLETSAKLSTGGFTSQEIAIDGLTTAMNAFGISYDDVNTVADKFIHTQNKGKTSVNELASSIGNVAGIAANAGVSFDELLSATASLTMNGLTTSEAMNGLKAAFSNIIKPSGQAAKIANELGIEFNAAALESKGLAGFLQDVQDKTGGNIETMAQLFGSTEALNAILTLTGEGADEFSSTLEGMANSAGLTEDAFNSMNESAGKQFLNSINELKIALVSMGDALAPVISWLAEKLSELAQWFDGLDEGGRKAVVAMAGLAMAIGPVLSGVGSLMMIGGNLSTMLASGMGAGAASGALTALATGGVALAVTAFLGLIDVIGNSETAISSLQDTFGVVGIVIGGICETLAGAIDLFLGNAIIMIGGVGKAVMALFKGDFAQIDDIAKETWAKVENNTAKAMSNLAQDTTHALQTLKQSTSKELEGVNKIFEMTLQQWPELTAQTTDEVARAFANGMQGLNANSIEILKGTSDVMSVLMDGIKEGMSIEDATKKFEANLESMVKSGKYNMETIEKDVKKAMDLIEKNVGDGSTQMKQRASDMFNAFKTSAQFGMTEGVDNVVSQLKRLNQESLDTMTSMGDTWSQVFEGIKLDGSMTTEQMRNIVWDNINGMGMDVNDIISNLRRESSDHWKGMEEDAKQVGEGVATSFEQIPEEIVTTLIANGATSKAEIERVNSIYESLPDEIQTYIKANNYEALAGANDVQDVLAKIPLETKLAILSNVEGKEDVSMLKEIVESLPEEERIKFETQMPNKAELDDLKQKTEELDGKEATTKATVEADSSQLDEIKSNLDSLETSKDVDVNVNTGNGAVSLEQIKGTVNTLPDSKQITVTANTSQAQANISSVDNKKIKDKDVKVKANTKDAESKISKVDNKKLKDKTVNLKANDKASSVIDSINKKVLKDKSATYTITTKYKTVGSPGAAPSGATPGSFEGGQPIPFNIEEIETLDNKLARATISTPIDASSSATKDAIKYNIELLQELENRIYLINNQLNVLDKKMDQAVGSEKIGYLEQQNKLYREQLVVQKELESKLKEQQSHIKNSLSQKGFQFTSDGNLRNYEEKLLAMDREAERLEKRAKEASDNARDYSGGDENYKKKLEDIAKKEDEVSNQYKDNLNTIKDELKKYLDITFNDIPKAQEEWLELNNQIADTSLELEKLNREQKLFTKNSKLSELEMQYDVLADRLDIIDIKMKHVYGKDKTKLIEEQIKLLKEQQKIQEQIIATYEESLKVYQSDLSKFGFEFDKDGTIKNLDEILNKHQNSKDLEKIKDLVEDYIKLQRDELPDAIKEWENLDSAIKDSYKEQLEIVKDVEKQITDIYKKEIEKRKDLIDSELKKRLDAIKKEQDAYNKNRKEEDYQKDYNKQLKVIEDLEKQIADVSKDGSLSGQKKLQELMDKLKEEQEKLQDMVQDKVDQDINDAFDKESEKLEEEAEKTIEDLENKWSDSKIAEAVKEALGSGTFKTIDGEIVSLKDTMLDFISATEDGMGVLGDIIKNEFLGSLEEATQAVKDLENIFGQLGVGKFSMPDVDYKSSRFAPPATNNTSTVNNNSKNVTVNFNSPLMHIEGNVDNRVLGDLKKLSSEIEAQVTNNIIKSMR